MMQEIKRFQVRGVPGEVVRLKFGARTVDYWKPQKGSDKLLIAHDGQNVFDGKSSTHRGQTWEMAQSAIRVSRELGISTPSIIGVWHSSTKENPWGRGKDLVPEKYFREGIEVHNDFAKILEDKSVLQSDSYFREIFETIVPTLEPEIDPKNTAMIGSSMGALATLYAVAQMPEKFTTALALSPHWPFGANALVEKTINSLPVPGTHKVWRFLYYGFHAHEPKPYCFGCYQNYVILAAHGLSLHNLFQAIDSSRLAQESRRTCHLVPCIGAISQIQRLKVRTRKSL